MHSPCKQLDRELYQEIVLMMEILVKYVPDKIAVEALQGFHKVLDALKVKINTHNYTPEDESFNRIKLQ
jgi:hypothetical protein